MLFPDAIDAPVMLGILGGGAVLGLVVAAAHARHGARRGPVTAVSTAPTVDKATWRMPPLDRLAPPQMAASTVLRMTVLRCYLVLAGGLVLVRIVMLTVGRG